MGFAVRGADKRWRSGIVPFRIHSSIQNNAASRQAVQAAINHWNANTCLQLVRRGSERDFVEFIEHSSA